MNNLKPAIIAGVGGFGLSLLIALVSGVRLPDLLIRPLIFGGIFFGFGAGALYLYRRFLSEISEEHNTLGQNVNISVDDDDAKMMIGTDGTDMDFTGFAEVNMPQDHDDYGEQEGNDTESGFSQNEQGLEQNSTLGYTENNHDANNAFKPMDFDVLSQSTGKELDREQKVYARVPEMEKVVNADPKKLASTVQNLLSDE
jgi:hypothetical protein